MEMWEPQSLGDWRSVRLGVETRINVIVLARQSQSQSYFAIDSLSICTSWCRAHSGTCDQMLFFFGR
jgi:hypothetical protein